MAAISRCSMKSTCVSRPSVNIPEMHKVHFVFVCYFFFFFPLSLQNLSQNMQVWRWATRDVTEYPSSLCQVYALPFKRGPADKHASFFKKKILNPLSKHRLNRVSLLGVKLLFGCSLPHVDLMSWLLFISTETPLTRFFFFISFLRCTQCCLTWSLCWSSFCCRGIWMRSSRGESALTA